MKAKIIFAVASIIALVIIGITVVTMNGSKNTAPPPAGASSAPSVSQQIKPAEPKEEQQSGVESSVTTDPNKEAGGKEAGGEAKIIGRIDADNKVEYSTDGGVTWTTEKPEGM